ncbi:MAG: short-chain dehydrogenase [Frankiales bacterium]|nr:short-chain dehydrogenase [Frankiales bacterium]
MARRAADSPASQSLSGRALVTGATAGIGAAFARRLAAEGRDLILVARDAERLGSFAEELHEHYLVDVEVLPADLTTDSGCDAVAQRLRAVESPVDTLVNNAGMGLYQPLAESRLESQERLLDLNVRAVLRLTHAAVTAMLPRGRGEIINISSVAAYVPRGPAATYGASKAWVSSFTEGVALSLAGTGVRVAAIVPGFTRTEFHQRVEGTRPDPPNWMWLAADRVVADGLADLRRGRVLSVPSRRYRALLLASRFTPRPLLRRVMTRR